MLQNKNYNDIHIVMCLRFKSALHLSLHLNLQYSHSLNIRLYLNIMLNLP
jgi:hypothetical protein